MTDTAITWEPVQPPVTFVRHSHKLVEVKLNNIHAGWLDRNTGKKDGMTGPRSRYHYWTGIVRGNGIRSTTLTGVKEKAVTAARNPKQGV